LGVRWESHEHQRQHRGDSQTEIHGGHGRMLADRAETPQLCSPGQVGGCFKLSAQLLDVFPDPSVSSSFAVDITHPSWLSFVAR
jgi:hypothetical protein